MAYIQVLTHMEFPKDYYSTDRDRYCLGGRLRIRYYSSQVVSEPKEFHRLSKKGQKLRNRTYIYFS